MIEGSRYQKGNLLARRSRQEPKSDETHVVRLSGLHLKMTDAQQKHRIIEDIKNILAGTFPSPVDATVEDAFADSRSKAFASAEGV